MTSEYLCGLWEYCYGPLGAGYTKIGCSFCSILPFKSFAQPVLSDSSVRLQVQMIFEIHVYTLTKSHI